MISNNNKHKTLYNESGVNDKDLTFITSYVLDRLGKITYYQMVEGLETHFGRELKPFHLIFTGMVIKEIDYMHSNKSLLN